MIDSLQSLRGIFAVCIFLHHYNLCPGAWEAVFPAGGSLGVAFFFVLSGFVMCLGHADKALNPQFSLGRFMKRRVIRTWPLHLIATAAFVLLNLGALNASSIAPLITNIAMLQSWIPEEKYFFSGNSVSWCLCDLMFFYLMFPFLVRMFRRRLVGKGAVAGLSLYSAAYIAACLLIFTPLTMYIYPAMRLADFMVGMGLYMLWQHCLRTFPPLGTTLATAIEVSAVLLCIGSVILWPHINMYIGLASWWWLPIAAIILTFALTTRLTPDNRGGFINRMLQFKLPVVFGNASFSFYVFHVLGIRICNILADKCNLNLSPEAALAPVFVIVTAASLLIWKFVEIPLARRLADLRLFR